VHTPSDRAVPNGLSGASFAQVAGVILQ